MENPQTLSFSQFTQLCARNLEKKYVAECIDTIKNRDCLFNAGAILPHERTLSLYKLRLGIAKDGNRKDENYLADFEALAEKIRVSTSDHIGITSLYGDHFTYSIFYEQENQLILGILKTASSMTDEENLATEHVSLGLTSGLEKYSKNIFVRHWKSKT